MKTFPALYKLTSTGALQSWEISVEGNVIVTRYGQVNGAVQTATDTIKEGKNLGKRNATTPEQQAVLEALSKWEKQKKNRGYVETIEAAQAGERDALVTGGVDPMLAHKYSERAKHIQFPALAQPKLDGIRCIAVVNEGSCSLWSRTRKPITGVPHIATAVEAMCERSGLKNIVLDGELYNHEWKANFEQIVSLVRQETPQSGHEIVQYHMYDIVDSEQIATDRIARLRLFMEAVPTPLVMVETREVGNEDALLAFFADCLALGYEGAMARNFKGKYVGKRSNDLQKVKEMQDAEYTIIEVREGRGKMEGKAIFTCVTETGETFEVKMKGSLKDLEKYVEDPSLAIGEPLTVQFQNLTAKGLPRFPVGIRLRARGF